MQKENVNAEVVAARRNDLRRNLIEAEVHPDGRYWYVDAHAECVYHAELFEVDYRRFIPVVSVLSCQTPWQETIPTAVEAVKLWREDHLQTARLRATEYQRRRVAAILEGRPYELGWKTASFAKALLLGRGRDAVVIDRHAVSVAMGRPPMSGHVWGITSLAGYEALVDLYVEVAKMKNMNPVDFQAGTWMAYKEAWVR